MPKSLNKHDVYIEIGEKRVFAGAIEWPGWCRSGRNEESAVQALLDSGSRYSHILRSTELGFVAPEKASSFNIVERLDGNSTTDFGAPDAPLPSDKEPINANELLRLPTLLKSCWVAFDKAVIAADGMQLRKGPRGGGRDLKRIIHHVLMADESDLKRSGWKMQNGIMIVFMPSLKALDHPAMAATKASMPPVLPARQLQYGELIKMPDSRQTLWV